MIGLKGKKLYSERLSFRLLEDCDKESLYPILQEPETTKPAGYLPLKNENEFEKFWDNLTAEGTGVAILLNGGCIGYYHALKYVPSQYAEQKNIGIGFLIGKDYVRKGYGTETLMTLDKYLLTIYDNIWGDYFTENTASKKILEKCGFKYFETYEMNFECLNNEKKTVISNILNLRS